MFHSESGAHSSPVPAPQRTISLPPPDQSVLRIIMLGDLKAIQRMINRMAIAGIADANHWSRPQNTGRAGEYIVIHTKRMRTDTI